MADNTFELPPTPPTAESGPAIDPSSTAVPAAPRPTAPVPPSTTSSPWYPSFELPSAAPAGLAATTASARARRAAVANRTRMIVGGASVASFVAILAAVGLHGGSQPASNVNATQGDSSASLDPGSGSGSTDSPFSRRFGGGFSATPGSGSSSPNTRSHGS
ncbi:MAG TPA: hypothetical protein VGO87_00610 [Acidimicrobiia bacterium]|jgi:hypothetical protein